MFAFLSVQCVFHLLATGALTLSSVAGTSTRVPAERRCEAPTAEALLEPERARLDQILLRIDALFRLHRTKAAAQELDAAVRSLTRSPAPGVDPDERQALLRGLATYRKCLVETSAPPLATLTVRTLMQSAETSRDAWPPAPGGGYIYVNQIRVGRTAADGTATLQVPSGTSDIDIVLAGGDCGSPPSCAGSTTVNVRPGGSRTASVVITDSKDPAEDTDVELVEPADATLRASTSSWC